LVSCRLAPCLGLPSMSPTPYTEPELPQLAGSTMAWLLRRVPTLAARNRSAADWIPQQTCCRMSRWSSSGPSSPVDDDSSLQGYWREMETRVTRRRPRVDGPSGRTKPRKTEADMWLEAGLYDNDGGGSSADAATPMFARMSSVQVKPQAVDQLAAAYRTKVFPILEECGAKRAFVLYDPAEGKAHSLSLWSEESDALLVRSSDAYSAAMADLSRLMDGVPESRDLHVIADSRPESSSS